MEKIKMLALLYFYIRNEGADNITFMPQSVPNYGENIIAVYFFPNINNKAIYTLNIWKDEWSYEDGASPSVFEKFQDEDTLIAFLKKYYEGYFYRIKNF